MSVRVGVDLGKTRCRVLVDDSGRRLPPVEGTGARGLAEPGGVTDAVAAVIDALTLARTSDRQVTSLCVAAAGARAAPSETEELAHELARRVDADEVAVTSDAVAAHVGALDGGSGVVLSVGTGSVALAVAEDGRAFQVDGWGPALGDDGSGAWIGREALRSVLRSREGRGPDTALTHAAELRFGELSGISRALTTDSQATRTLASFVPEVVRCAEAGDAEARLILERAGRALADTTVAAADAVAARRVTAVGGLTVVSR
ncbi:MAG: N-acetylglucosamine kinase, partial [Pseudonocardiaceae bacterium]